LVARVLNACDFYFCLSQSDLELCHELAPTAPGALITNPTAADVGSRPADLTDEVVFFAGQVGVRKGVDVLLRAWEEVRRFRPKAKLVVAGPATSLVVPVTSNVEMLGPIDNQRTRELMRAARVVVLPSRDEALPVVLTEALAAGRPFVSTPVGGIPWLAQGVQKLVEVGDAHALALALVELLADPGLAAARGEAGREFHRRILSVEAADVMMRGHYEDAIARRHHQTRASSTDCVRERRQDAA
jgi:glycosyltransferase involved in cell wall biosynthesis